MRISRIEAAAFGVGGQRITGASTATRSPTSGCPAASPAVAFAGESAYDRWR
ncbi:hypothetical protein [Micromonospora sp. HNM0581]|uniref:hypothetical protein n=1 Tax=Micromonospora sp. HNM0581 TaxID=2716341 RepID=UPI001F0F4A34|nr:hypothetical protein [Micromonospora sp. HNM0581]